MTKPTLKQVYDYTVGTAIGTQSHVPQTLSLGEFTFQGNPKFAQLLLNKLAKRTGNISPYKDYLTWFKEKPFAEKEPDKDAPNFKIFRSGISPFERRVLGLAKYVTAKKAYDKRYRRYSEIQERARPVVHAFEDSLFGYLSFVSHRAFAHSAMGFPKSLADDDRFFFTQTQNFSLQETDRQKHTYITAGSGHGKSVTIETIIHHYLTQKYDEKNAWKKPALVLIDPHGDLATKCARLKANLQNDNLVYIKPSLSNTLTPTFNPFETHAQNWADLNKTTDTIIEVFKEIMKSDGEGTSFTPQMVTILKPCVTALLKNKGATFTDLIDFLDDEPSIYEPYLHTALNTLTNPMHVDALKRDFHKDTFNPSKLSIKTKIRNLLNDDFFFNFLVGKSTFDLEAEINRRAFLVFDLSDLTEKSRNSIGRFITAYLTSIALSRASIPEHKRIPIHLFIDECQNFVSDSMKTILTESRKFKLFGTFAQQFCGQGMNTELKRAIIGNSFIKISGHNEQSSLKTIAAETGAPIEELEELKPGEFHIKSGRVPSIKVKIPMIDDSEKMDEIQWKQTVHDQLQKYYRNIQTTKEVEEELAENIKTATKPASVKRALPASSNTIKKANQSRVHYQRKPQSNPFSQTIEK